MAKLTEQQMGQLNQTAQADPAWQQAMALPYGSQRFQALREVWDRAAMGLVGAPLDQIENIGHYNISGKTGEFTRKGFISRHPHWSAAMAAGGAAGGAAALMAGSAGGAGAAAAPAAGGAATAAGGTAAGTGAALGSTSLATGSAAAGAGGLGAGAALPTAAGTMAGGAGSATAAGGAVAGGSRVANMMRTGSQAASAYGQAAAANRGTALEATMDQDRTRLQAETDRRAGERDAMRGLAQTSYIQNWQPRQSSIQGLPTYGFGPQAPSEAQRQGAATLEGTLLNRLETGGFQPSDTSSMMKPSGGERAAGWIGTGLSLYGAYSGNKGSSALGNALANRGGAQPTQQGSSPMGAEGYRNNFVDQSGMDRWNTAATQQNGLPAFGAGITPLEPIPSSYSGPQFEDQNGMARWEEALRKQRGR